MKKFFLVLLVASLPVAVFAAVAKRQSAIQDGTTVRAKTDAVGLYDEECYDSYYGCMDQFCISDNANGGSCMCSNDNARYEAELAEINKMLVEAERIKTVEVEKVQLGANADIVFGGGRQYDENGNVKKVGEQSSAERKKSKREELLKMFNTATVFDDEEDDDSIMSKTGAALFTAADETCSSQVDSKCNKDIRLLRQMYQRQIDSDCRGFANSIAKQKSEAQMAMNSAEAELRNALKDSFDSANKYNQGECMVEFKKCMTGSDACGADWMNCVSTIASENMQNDTALGTYAGTKVKTTVSYGITVSVMERLESKRTICERVLDQCMAVRDDVWPAFLREIAPTLKLAELNAESNMRQSCLTDITKCLHTACKDDIAGKGVATMDACLSRPTMARDFCKVQIEPCERMAGANLWTYVEDKLAAMRVDACTQEVKDCFMDENRCGPDFMNCIGMDYDFIHNLCPLDKLVVCKKNNPKFSMNDIDSMITGLYLNIDNQALDNCQKLIDTKMAEICGSTTDCNRFASDDTIGTGSLRSVKDKNIYRITGMISFGSIKVGNTKEDAGKVDVSEYIGNARKYAEQYNIKDSEGIIDTIEHELNNIQGTINRVIDMISADQKIQFCVDGRNLEQIVGAKGARVTNARFPNILNEKKQQIAVAALRQAQTNYENKYNEYLAKVVRDASVDVAQYTCQMLPTTGGDAVGGKNLLEKENEDLNPPYAISYEVGTGISNKLLAQGGRGSTETSGKTEIPMPIGKKKIEFSGGTREMWATFNRETRICRLCSSTVTKDCTHSFSSGFWGIGAKDEVTCDESEPVEKCDDIEM